MGDWIWTFGFAVALQRMWVTPASARRRRSRPSRSRRIEDIEKEAGLAS